MTTRTTHRRAAMAACLGFLALTTAAAADPAPATVQATAPSMEKLADQALAKVRERLQLTGDQVTRIRPLLIEHFGTLRGLLVEYSGAGGPSMPALMQEIRETRDHFQSTLEPILTPAQQKEALVIRQEVDQKIKDTVCDALVAALQQPLSLTDDQVPRVRPILCDDFERKRAVLAIHTGPTGGAATRRTLLPEIQKIQADTEARLRQVLSADQMKEYEAVRAAAREKARQSASPNAPNAPNAQR
jgi:hypothetical protein